MDLHGVGEGYHPRAKQIDRYRLITDSDRFITYGGSPPIVRHR